MGTIHVHSAHTTAYCVDPAPTVTVAICTVLKDTVHIYVRMYMLLLHYTLQQVVQIRYALPHSHYTHSFIIDPLFSTCSMLTLVWTCGTLSFHRSHTPVKKGGIGPVNIPLMADVTKKIARDYGVLNEETGVALRWVPNNNLLPSKGLLFLHV